jgi:hypothetical protein
VKLTHPTLGPVILTIKHCDPGPSGRETVATFKSEAGGVLCQGKARCVPEDNFCRKRGVQLALARAFKAGEACFGKEFRRNVWDAVWNHKYSGGAKRRAD